jgi:type II secretory pathway component GspD/PulD (secretin)
MSVLRRRIALAVLLSASAVFVAAAAPPNPGLNARVDVNLRHASIARFLDVLSAQSRVSFVLAEGVQERQITAFLHGVTVREALDDMKASSGVGYRSMRHGKTVLIAPADSGLLQKPPLIEGGRELDTVVSIRVRGVPLDQFLEALSAQTRSNFVVDESLKGRRVTAFLEDVTAREALEIVLGANGLSCRRVDASASHRIASEN